MSYSTAPVADASAVRELGSVPPGGGEDFCRLARPRSAYGPRTGGHQGSRYGIAITDTCTSPACPAVTCQQFYGKNAGDIYKLSEPIRSFIRARNAGYFPSTAGI